MSYNPYSLEDKRILVTGASSGIGQATAIECSRLGALVVLVGRNQTALDETLSMMDGEGHQIVVSDLTKQEDVEKLVIDLPLIDGIVLCAGKSSITPLQFAKREKLDDIFSINLFSPIEMMRLMLKGKKIKQPASVVFVSSVGGTRVFNAGNSVYGASKAAFSSIMKYYAIELANKKIRVNAVNPGMTVTKMIQSGTFTDEERNKDIQLYPLKRYGIPIEIALSITFLLSDASSWITGHELIIDGGLSI